MRRPLLFVAVALSATLPIYACTTVVTNAAPGSTDDGGTTSDGAVVSQDSGVNPVSATYPAKHAPLPPVTYNGGNIIDTPKVVSITYDGDTLRTAIDQFGAAITATDYWKTVTSEYCDARGKCIGAGSGTAVHIATAPDANYTDSSGKGAASFQTYINARIQDGTLPVPDAETIFVFYTPSATTISLDGAASCTSFGGYHNAMTVTPPEAGAAIQFSYAVVPRCTNKQDDLTFAASHEIVESATDPLIASGNQSYYAFGSDSDAWDYVSGGGEVGDRCVDETGAGLDQYHEDGYVLQRIWSNAAAAGSHDPCVPAPSPSTQPYFNIAPVNGATFVMGVGETQTIELIAFSDAKTEPFTVDVQEVSQYLGGTDVLDLTIDGTTMQNGQHVNVTIFMRAAPKNGLASFVVNATLGQVTHFWPIVVSTQ